MLEEMVGISLDSMLDKWHRISKGIANQNRTGNVVAARAEGTRNGNQARCYNCRGLGQIARNCTTRPRRRDAAYLQTQLLIAQKKEAGIQLLAEEFDFMAAAGDLDEIEEVNANCILMVNLQHASTSGTQHDRAPVYDTDDSAENDNHVTSVALSMVPSGGTVETSSAPNKETRAHQDTVYRNLVDQWELSPGSGNALCILFPTKFTDIITIILRIIESPKNIKVRDVWFSALNKLVWCLVETSVDYETVLSVTRSSNCFSP
nr:hypothetical protein [Tanacetum cinerariifolium]